MDDPFEDRARSLLTLAAETIPVASAPVSVVRRAPAWPWLVAMATVLLVVVGLPCSSWDSTRTPPPPRVRLRW